MQNKSQLRGKSDNSHCWITTCPKLEGQELDFHSLFFLSSFNKPCFGALMAMVCFALIYDEIKPLMSFGMDHSTTSHLVKTERRHFGGIPNHDTPNPCLISLDQERTIPVFTPLWPCPRMVQVVVSHFPLPQEVLIQLYSTFKIHFITTTGLKMPGNVGSSHIHHTWSWSCPKTQERGAPGLSSWTEASKTSTVTLTFWVATPKSCWKISLNPRE